MHLCPQLPPHNRGPRESRELGGFWSFLPDYDEVGLRDCWHATPLAGPELREIPVPCAYNDLFPDARLRDHLGLVWYEHRFHVPVSWQGRVIALRFGAVAHHARVWLNGFELGIHSGGFLPFSLEASAAMNWTGENRLTVAVDNRLTWQTLPPGEVHEHSAFRSASGQPLRTLEIHFDFFHYAGLTRPVHLIALPVVRVESTRMRVTRRSTDHWQLSTDLTLTGAARVQLTLLDPAGNPILTETSPETRSGQTSCTLAIDQPVLWEPGCGRLHTLEIRLLAADGAVLDEVVRPVGFRTVAVRDGQVLINDRAFHFRGFGLHEDADFTGRGLNLPVLTRDFALLRWIGANSVRTSHYPYAEEFLDLADRQGLVVIGEAPAVGQHVFGSHDAIFTDEKINSTALAGHRATIEAMIERDHHHPCIVAWSVANEPSTDEPAALPYFESIAACARQADPDRPIMIVEVMPPDKTRVAHLFDLIGVNQYCGWYFMPGRLEIIEAELERSLRFWHDRFGKPVLVTEYGADTVAGLHAEPAVMFSEEFQVEFLRRFEAVIRCLPFVVGGHVWNLADFATKQGLTRVGGNRKGVFTRQRQPKAAAHLLRALWQDAPSS